ncbi:MAG: hypothetical protein ABIJ36_03720 [Patescibacteria group bacterium]
MSKKLIITTHILFLILIIVGVVFAFLKNNNCRIENALLIYTSRERESSLNAEISKLKLENDKFKFYLKQLEPADYAGWKTFENKSRGYFFMYPSNAVVDESDAINVLYIKSPNVDISIIHFDSPFYHPPAGTNVRLWVLDKVSYDEVGESIKILGTDTLHLVTNKSPQVYAADDYFFIKDGQMYDIKIVPSGDKQDWELYYKFLKSLRSLL